MIDYPLTEFGRRLVLAMPHLTDDWEISERDAGLPLDKVLTIKTPGFEMPEDARQAIRDLAIATVPVAYRVTLEFDSGAAPAQAAQPLQ